MPVEISAGTPVRYHLRVSLTPAHHREEEKALWKILRRGRIDEVLFFVPHAEERSPGLGTDAENEQMAEILAPAAFARLRKARIAPSINVWWTVSFSEFPGLPRDLHDRFDFRWAVTIDGRESRSNACPGCGRWRAQVQKMYRTYSQLKPVRIWIDDDVRMTLRADMHCPCFCNECLAEMGRRAGRPLSRPELLKGILADPPNPVRDAWLDYQRQLGLEIVGGIAAAVHEVSPDTHVSLMHSGVEIHSAEGRRWNELIGSLGTPPPMLRPGIGPYVDMTGPAITGAFNGARLCQAAYPPGTAVAPEIENYPHSRFTKSAALVRANLVLAQLIGIPEMTFSISRFGGRLDLEAKREEVWSGLLASMKPRLQAIADLGIRREQLCGVSLYWHEESARHARGVTSEPKPIFTYRQRPWDQALPLMGIATRYGLGELTVFGGEHIGCLSEEEIEDVFSRGVLLDARAAESLLPMGKGDLAGLVRRLPDAGASMETIEDAAFGGIVGDVINARWTSTAWQFEWQPREARTVSRLRGYRNEERGHGVVLFENRLGGRVVVYPYDTQGPATVSLGAAFSPMESPSFICRPRQAQLRAVLEWAGRRPLPLYVPEAPCAYPLLVEQENRLIVGVANLMPDPVDSLTIRLRAPAWRASRVRVLMPDGRWQVSRRARIGRPTKGAITIETGVALNYLDVAVMIIE